MKVKIEFEISKELFDKALELGTANSLKLAIKDAIRAEFAPWNMKALKNFNMKVKNGNS